MMIGPIALALIALTACAQQPATETRPKRGMTVEDVLSVENLGAIALSPDGAWAAVVIQRSKSEGGFHSRTRLGGDDRADIWMVSLSTGERERITNGAVDGSGSWAPSWSPDGEWLAMLSSQGDDNARLHVWSRKRGTIERVADEGIHLGAALAVGGVKGYGLAWIDNSTLLAVLAAPDFRPFDFGGDQEAQRIAQQAWKKMERGNEPSVSVLVSGEGAQPIAAVASVKTLDVARREAAHLTDVKVALLSEPQVSWSPSGRHLIVFETAPTPRPAPGRMMTFDDRGKTRVGVVPVGTKTVEPRWLDGLERPSLETVLWSPDGRALAVLAASQSGGGGAGVFEIDLSSGALRRLTPPDWRVQQFLWLDSLRLIVKVFASGKNADPSPRDDWWVVMPSIKGQSPERRNVTASLPESPATITDIGNGILLAVVKGDLWQIDPDGEPRNLSSNLTPEIRGVVPRQVYTTSKGPGTSEIVVRTGDDVNPDYFRVVLDGSPPKFERVSKPTPLAKADAHWPSQRALVFRATEENGVFAWTSSLSTGRLTQLAALNGHLADVAPAQEKLIEVRGAAGDTLHAVVLLPYDYDPGRRYPVLTWVYAGLVFREIGRQRSLTSKYSDSSLNLLPLLTRGYAVLFPSMPLAPEGQPSDPLFDLPKGVIAAVDKLIELGIADPNRLAVGGHSHGGYSTLCMIVSTNRFKAAIAAAGTSNLVSAFGTFDARFRYGDTSNEGVSRMRWIEGGQGRMAGPPYENYWRYLRNSPIFYVDRVETPLLLIQGDLDFVPIMQGEEFFSALLRQGKEARFLRYFGESHSIESPANSRHMGNEILEWLDKHLEAGKPSSRKK